MNYDLDDLHNQISKLHAEKVHPVYLVFFDNEVRFSETLFGIHLSTWDEWAIETGTQSKTILEDWVTEAIQFYTDRKEQERLSER